MAINWQKYWNELAQKEDFHAQVGRTLANKSIDNEVINQIVKRIIDYLDLQPSDILIDICCGNGMISKQLAKHCQKVIAVDISPQQIAIAQQFNTAANISYLVGDAQELSQIVHNQANKINLYFSFQYFDSINKGQRALSEMQKCLLSKGKIFLGDVPEKEKWRFFYASFRSKIWFLYYELRNRNPMGKFWSRTEMEFIAQKAGFTIEKIVQPADLPYAHYRCDFLLEK